MRPALLSAFAASVRRLPVAAVGLENMVVDVILVGRNNSGVFVGVAVVVRRQEEWSERLGQGESMTQSSPLQKAVSACLVLATGAQP